jgi:hypothetical protein
MLVTEPSTTPDRFARRGSDIMRGLQWPWLLAFRKSLLAAVADRPEDALRRLIEYAPLWGLWTNQFVGGRLHQAMETADQVLAMALSAGDATLEVTGRHATFLYPLLPR